MTVARQRLGRAAEDLVARRLNQGGWRIVERNTRTRSGELDLIALDGATLVFVEVKAGRTGARSGPERPAFAVGPRKQLQVRRLAREWLGRNSPPGRVEGYRFDVVGVTFDGAGNIAHYEHIENAF
jgi:putative endonuclease